MSAGSYKDMTRVASLNSNMWSELFLENGDNLLNEIDNIINNLTEYRNAIASNDRARFSAIRARLLNIARQPCGRLSAKLCRRPCILL